MNDIYTKERTGHRNSQYSGQHRRWGKIAMFDIDSVEVDSKGNPVAMVELKHGYGLNGEGITIDFFSFEFTFLRKTAELLKVPLFCTVYYPTGHDDLTGRDDLLGDHWQFYVYPVNGYANARLDYPTQMTEKQWVEFLHQLRSIGTCPEAGVELDKTWIDIPLPRLATGRG